MFDNLDELLILSIKQKNEYKPLSTGWVQSFSSYHFILQEIIHESSISKFHF